jgi:protein-disulfide isomerase
MAARLSFIIGILVVTAVAAAAQFGPSQYPIKDDDGDLIANHDIPAAVATALERTPGIVAVGNPKGDVTIFEFYDLNCPGCREAAADMDALLRKDGKLKLVFVPYPILSVQSVEGGRVELAVAGMVPPEQFLEFRRTSYAGRGVIDGARALAAAQGLGLDPAKIIAAANDDETTDKLKSHARLATALGLVATPSYVIEGVAFLGHPGLAPLERVIAAVRQCGRVSC